MSSIGILGGGWLGSALAAKAIEKDHRVKITTTTPEKTTPLVFIFIDVDTWCLQRAKCS